MACFMVDEIEDCFDSEMPFGHRVGAMFWWNHGRSERDTTPRSMPHLAVMTIAGLACLDCPASEPDPPGTYWTRTGEPPIVTVTPSLNINPNGTPTWHGFLANGALV